MLPLPPTSASSSHSGRCVFVFVFVFQINGSYGRFLGARRVPTPTDTRVLCFVIAIQCRC